MSVGLKDRKLPSKTRLAKADDTAIEKRNLQKPEAVPGKAAPCQDRPLAIRCH